MASMDRFTGKVIEGTQVVQQALHVLLASRKGCLVMNRHYGSDVPNLIDKNMGKDSVMSFYSAIAQAVDQFEPRLKISKVTVQDVKPEGTASISLSGTINQGGKERVVEFGL